MARATAARRSRSRANGEGSVYQRKDGRWAAALTLADGRRWTAYDKTRAQVERKLRAQRANQDKGLPVVIGSPIVSEYLSQWIESMRFRVRPATWKAYESLLRVHAIPRLSAVRLINLSAKDLEALYAAARTRGLSPSSCRKLHSVIHRALADAQRHGDVHRNAADLARLDYVARPEMKILTQTQTLALLEAAKGSRIEALLTLALTSGMRQGELLALRWQDVNLDAGWVRVTATLQRRGTDGEARLSEPKTPTSRRQIMLPPLAVEALRRHRESQGASVSQPLGLVFPNEAGRPWDVRNLVRRHFEPLLASAGLPRIRWHDLRHTFCTLMLELGINPKIVSEMAGHSNVSITLGLYSHALPGMHRGAAALLGDALTLPASSGLLPQARELRINA